nr:small integral membrane protein 33 [Rousettus aegyptiacus]
MTTKSQKRQRDRVSEHSSWIRSALPAGWPLSLAFFSCEWLSGAGAPEKAPGSARRSLGTTSRGWAAPAHRHCSCLCSAGSLYCGSSPLWAKATQGPCYSPHRATSPKTGRWHLPHPLASAGPPGQS